MTAAELRALLEPHGIRPIKGRSQHFLLDDRVVEAMCNAAGIANGTRVLEIGPGPGILTAALLSHGADVVAVELDMKLCALLRGRFIAGDAVSTNPAHFTLLEGDVLRYANTNLASAFSSGIGEYILVANLPYAITSAVFQKFLLEAPIPTRMVVMIQKEVADRLLAKPGEMGSLSVLAQTYARVHRVRDVGRGAFLPPPKVDSSVIILERRPQAEIETIWGSAGEKRYFSLIQAAFAAPRKQIRNTLRAVVPDAEMLQKMLILAKIDPSARPETLNVEDWGRLAKASKR